MIDTHSALVANRSPWLEVFLHSPAGVAVVGMLGRLAREQRRLRQ
jgi:hypothetical protein